MNKTIDPQTKIKELNELDKELYRVTTNFLKPTGNKFSYFIEFETNKDIPIFANSSVSYQTLNAGLVYLDMNDYILKRETIGFMLSPLYVCTGDKSNCFEQIILQDQTPLTLSILATSLIMYKLNDKEYCEKFISLINDAKNKTALKTTILTGVSHACINDILRSNKGNSTVTLDETGEIRHTGKTEIKRLFEDVKNDISPACHVFFCYALSKIEPKKVSPNLEALEIIFTLEEYLKEKGIENNKENRKYHSKEINKYLNALKSLSIVYDNKKIDGGFINVFDSGRCIKGIIKIRIAPTFKQNFFAYRKDNKLTGRFNLVLPVNYLRIDTRRFKDAPSIYDKLYSQSNSNTGDNNEDILSVKKLLEYLGLNDKVYLSRNIEALERNLNHLVDLDILEWDYCHSKHEPLTDDEQDLRLDYEGNERYLPYKTAIECYINWTWKDERLKEYFNNHRKKRDVVKDIKKERKLLKKQDQTKKEKRIQKKTEAKIAELQAKKYLEQKGE